MRGVSGCGLQGQYTTHACIVCVTAGELAVTYLDEEMRISRGDKGNLFVLLMDDPDDRP